MEIRHHKHIWIEVGGMIHCSICGGIKNGEY